MAKSINKFQLFQKGAPIFWWELCYLLQKGGLKYLLPYFRLLKKSLKNESVIEYDDKAVIFFLIPPIPSFGFRRHLHLYIDKFILGKSNTFVGQVFIAVNRRCPFNCWYCSADNTPDNEPLLKDIERIILLVKNFGSSTIVFTGGEPLLRDDIDILIKRYSERLSFVILTSGYGLDAERARRLRSSGLFAISISLDHYDSKVNDKLRGREGAFDISLKAIKNARSAGLYTVVQTVVGRELLADGIGDFVEFVKKQGVDELFLLEPLNTGRLFCAGQDVSFDDETQKKLRALHIQTAKAQNGLKVIYSSYIEDPGKFGCGAGTQHVYIDTNGELWPCNFLPISLGNFLNDTETVLTRLKKYFPSQCRVCILKGHRHEFLKVYNQRLPIPFESVKSIFENNFAQTLSNTVCNIENPAHRIWKE